VISSTEPVFLTVRDSDGNLVSEELPGPGGTIRVIVGEPGRQSGSWRIWANPNTFDVYIGVRAILGLQKWSLHETGDWRYQWISDEKAASVGKVQNRIIQLWQRPAELGESGWTRGLSIRVRHQDLVEVATPEKVPAETLWLPPPPEGHMLALHVVIARPGQGETTLPPGLCPVGGFTLVEGRAALLVVSVDPVTDQHNARIEAALAEARILAAAGVDLSVAVAPRDAVSGYSE
jgi:hypothetical protein